MTLQDVIVKDEAAYRLWSIARTYCFACGIPQHRAWHERWPGTSTHHIVKFKRSHHPANLLRLCQRCHDLAELHCIRVDGVPMPWLPLSVTMTIKRLREPLEYSEAVLRLLWGRELPSPAPIPAVIEEEFRSNRPWDTKSFQKS